MPGLIFSFLSPINRATRQTALIASPIYRAFMSFVALAFNAWAVKRNKL